MKKNYVTTLWILALGLLSPLTSNAFCPDEDKTGWMFTDDILVWTADEEGLGFTNKPADVLVTDDFTTNSLTNTNFKWNWGFRLGLGYTSCDRNWTYDVIWTCIENKARRHVSYNSGSPDFEGIYPVWSMSPDTLVGDYVSAARSNWHLHTNLVDANVQYNFCWGERLLLMPFVGVRFASLRHKYTVKYAGGTFASGTDYNTMRNRFTGVGPRLGIDSDYYLGCGFSLDVMFAIDPMYSHYHITQREYYLDVERNHVGSKNFRFTFCYDYSVALKWKGVFLDSWPRIHLGIAWEGHEFFNMNRFPRGQYGFFKRDRNLTLNGVTLSAAFDF